MDFNFFSQNFLILLKGLTIGFYIASPIGPISVLCIKRTLKNGGAFGAASAFGVTSAEIFYASVAIFGLKLVADFLLGMKFFLHLVGGAFLLYLGLSTFFSKPKNDAEISIKKSWLAKILGRNFTQDLKNLKHPTTFKHLARAYFSILLLTLSNPMTIISFAAIFSGFALESAKRDTSESLLMLAGYGIGSVCCYLTLVVFSSFLRNKFDAKMMQLLNKISGAIIALFGIFILQGLAAAAYGS